MPLNSRAKGKNAELELVALLRHHGFTEARRGQQYSGIGGADVVGLPGIHIECKRVEAVRLHDWLAQAAADAPADKTPIVFHRRSRSPWYAILPAGAFLELLYMAEYGCAPGEIVATRTPLPDAAE